MKCKLNAKYKIHTTQNKNKYNRLDNCIKVTSENEKCVGLSNEYFVFNNLAISTIQHFNKSK